MTELVISLGSGKGTWAYLIELIKAEPWDRVVVVTNSFGAERFSVEGRELCFVVIDERRKMRLLVEDIKKQLELSGPEVALSMVSGEGKLHMAMLSALLKSGLGIRLVGMKERRASEL